MIRVKVLNEDDPWQGASSHLSHHLHLLPSINTTLCLPPSFTTPPPSLSLSFSRSQAHLLSRSESISHSLLLCHATFSLCLSVTFTFTWLSSSLYFSIYLSILSLPHSKHNFCFSTMYFSCISCVSLYPSSPFFLCHASFLFLSFQTPWRLPGWLDLLWILWSLCTLWPGF